MGSGIKYFLICVAIASLVIQCRDNSPSSPPKITHQKEHSAKNHKDEIQVPEIKYHLISVEENLYWLDSLEFGDTLNSLLALNRVDKEHLLRQDSIIVPDTISEDINFYSPYPEIVEALKPIRKILFISYYSQAFAAYENGIRKRWGPTSLGKELTPTTQGLYFTNWKKKKTRSTENWNWILHWYFNIENFRGISIHEFALPGYPASHACIRLLEDDAIWLYNWADQWVLKDPVEIAVYGTPVIVFGNFPFNGRKPWFDLTENINATQITSDVLRSELNKFQQIIMDRQSKRDSVMNNRGNDTNF